MIWIVGDGIVGRRIERLLGDHAIRFHDPRVEPTPSTDSDDVVILANPAGHAPLAQAFAAHGTSIVTVGDDLNDTRELLEFDGTAIGMGATVVVGAAMSPGLSGLLARHVANGMHIVDEIHVALHGTAGPSCARDHHRSLSGRAVGWRDGQWRYSLGGGGRELCWFPEPVGALDCYHAEIASPVLLHQSFPDAARIDARRSARRRDRFTARLPMLRTPHREGAVGALRVEVRGASDDGARVTSILGVAEPVGMASAATAAAFASAVLEHRLPPGVIIASDASLDTVALLRQIQGFGVRLQEFTGVAQSG